ncbi:unnamed protein product [marine sediment metagenome]|uniref:Uncharacterized protein n=1 Tax=marine sediment metagenome TaxID=412755 RepID=X1F342_9ZZZZ
MAQEEMPLGPDESGPHTSGRGTPDAPLRIGMGFLFRLDIVSPVQGELLNSSGQV